MKSLIGLVSLLLALAIVGLLTARQMTAAGHRPSPAASATGEAAPVPQLSGSGSVAEQSRRLQDQVVNDVAKSMQQGAQRQQEADPP